MLVTLTVMFLADNFCSTDAVTRIITDALVGFHNTAEGLQETGFPSTNNVECSPVTP